MLKGVIVADETLYKVLEIPYSFNKTTTTMTVFEENWTCFYFFTVGKCTSGVIATMCAFCRDNNVLEME